MEPISETISRMQDDRAKSKNKGFAMITTDFVQSDNYTIYEKIILIILKSFCFKSNLCWPSINKLAEKTPCSRGTVIKALKSLEDKRLIDKIKGDHISNTYRVKVGPFQDPLKPKW
jgi:DNA-binding MarR family transcriptional regulator